VTYGATIEDREAGCYPAQLQQLLGDGFEVRNFGHNGATLLRKGHCPYNTLPEYGEALEWKPDVVVIHLGLNDTDPRDWPDWSDDFIPDYRTLIDDFRKVNPDARIWVCRLTPIFHGHRRFLSGTRDWHSEIQKRIDVIAKGAKAGLIDLYSPLVLRPDLFADNLHPDAEGAGIIARTVYGAVTGDYGGLHLSPLYADGMVLQRGKPLRISGTADRGQVISVRLFHNVRKQKRDIASSTATADADGIWEVALPSLDAGGPYCLQIGDRTFQDVYVGEVWLCSGQSNMEFMLKDCDSAPEDLDASVTLGKLHYFLMKPRRATDNSEWAPDILSEVNRLQYFEYSGWNCMDREAASEFSAIGWHFGKALSDSLGCHVGLISCAVGGSTTESWCNRELLQWEYPQVLYDWYHGDFGQNWARGRAMKNIAASENPATQRHPYETGYLFDAAIRQMARYPIMGVLWYQGESNAHNIEVHERLFACAVDSWRSYWGECLPVEMIQLSGICRPSWPKFRDSQRKLAREIPGVYMTVCSDLGDPENVHPRTKGPIGERASSSALHFVYGRENTVPCGPEYSGFDKKDGSLILHFDFAEGLSGSKTFEVAGNDGIWHDAEAVIDGNSVIVRCRDVKDPCAVRYGWQPNPVEANLKNARGFPASTFIDGI